MSLYVDGKKIGEVVPGSVRIRLVQDDPQLAADKWDSVEVKK